MWLQAETTRTLASYPEATATSATWSLTTVEAYHKALPDIGPANEKMAGDPVYVVLLNGEFSETRTLAGSTRVVSGTQMILVFDPNSHDLSVVGILRTPADTSSLGACQAMSL